MQKRDEVSSLKIYAKPRQNFAIKIYAKAQPCFFKRAVKFSVRDLAFASDFIFYEQFGFCVRYG